MNTPNPLIPQGTSLEPKCGARSRVKIAVFVVLAIHVVGLMALLVQGCKREAPPSDELVQPPEVAPFEPVTIPPADTNQIIQQPVTDMPVGGAPGESGYPVTPGVETAVPVEPVAPAPAVVQEYAIKRGDTFYSIGKQFGVSMQAIKEANPAVEPTRLKVGQKIVIPAPGPAAVEAPAALPSASGEVLYTVVSGDTLSKIAAKHGTTWQAIQQLNNLPTTSIKVGQKLRIPAPKPPASAAPGSGSGM